eukprot:gb/GECG01003340.1/.p1 GENE.gb/GECG01003340.1/~~gb/GECG01003340.1/.p1  ORF type:complete len:825 (+),score=96.35 gb/GECG01003340.1/:1-2475(+)
MCADEPGSHEDEASYWKRKFEQTALEKSRLEGIVEELRGENDSLKSKLAESLFTPGASSGLAGEAAERASYISSRASEDESEDSDDTVDLEKTVAHKEKKPAYCPVPLSVFLHSRSISEGGEGSHDTDLHEGRPRHNTNLRQFATRLVEGIIVSGVPEAVTCSQVAALHAGAFTENEYSHELTSGSWKPPQLLPQSDTVPLKVVGESLHDDAASLINWFLPRGSCEQTKQFEWPKRSRVGVPLEDCVALLTKRLSAKLTSPQLHHFTTSCSDSHGEDAGLPSSTRYCICLVFPQPVCLDSERIVSAMGENIRGRLQSLLSTVNAKHFAVSQRCFTIVSRYPFFELFEKLLFAIYNACIRPEVERELEHIARTSMKSIMLLKEHNSSCWWQRTFGANAHASAERRNGPCSTCNSSPCYEEELSGIQEVTDTLGRFLSDWKTSCSELIHSARYEALYSWYHSKLSEVAVPDAGEKVIIPVDVFRTTYTKVDTIEWMRPTGTDKPAEIISAISSSANESTLRRGCLRFQNSQTSSEMVGLPLPTEEASMLIQFHALSHVLDVVPVDKLLMLLSSLLVEDYVIVAGRNLSFTGKGSALVKNLKPFRSIKHQAAGESKEYHWVPPEWKRERYMVSLITLLLQSLISPLRWIGPIVPVLPSDFEELLCSPVSILAGLECVGPDALSCLPENSIIFSLHDLSLSYGSEEDRSSASIPGRQRLMQHLSKASKHLRQAIGKDSDLRQVHEAVYDFAITTREHVFGLLVDVWSILGDTIFDGGDDRVVALESNLKGSRREEEIPFWSKFLQTQIVEDFCRTLQEEYQGPAAPEQ